MYVADDFSPKQSYRNLIRQAGFRGSVERKDFDREKATSVREINNFVSRTTNNKIQNLVKEDQVDDSTRLILVNAIYFKAPWRKTFAPQRTFTAPFFMSPTRQVDTSFMTQEDKLRTLRLEQNRLTVLELPYSNSNKSMLIILPDENSNNIASSLNNIDLSLVRQQTPSLVRVIIPKFTMKFETSLKETMKNLGARDVFSLAADLTAISDEPVFVTEAIHQAFIEVNEEGTEAAAATAAVVGTKIAAKAKVFKADRPFIFMIYDFDENIPLFAGKLVDPSNSVITRLDQPEVISPVSDRTGNKQRPPLRCSKQFKNFPTALENVKICLIQRVLGDDSWMTEERQANCTRSQVIKDDFEEGNCGSHWCSWSTKGRDAILQKWRDSCDSGIPSGANRKLCIRINNHLKAYKDLACRSQ